MNNAEKTVPEFITSRIKKYSGKILFQRKYDWSWKQITWLDFDSEIKNIASFLMGLGFGLGDTALVISSNRIESLLSEIAIGLLGGVTIPVAYDEDLENIIHVANDLKPRFIFVGEKSTLNRILSISDEISSLERIVVFSGLNIGENERVIHYRGLLKFGLLKRKQLEDKLAKTSKSVLPDSPAMVFYSFNSPKKIEKKEITQEDLIEALYSASEKLSFIGEEDQSFSYLPSVSPFEKFANLIGICMGIRIVMAETREDFFEDILEVKPTVLFETKNGLENICSKIISSKLGRTPPSERLKSELGSRIKYVITDSLPREDIKNLFAKSRVSLIDIPELNNLILSPRCFQ
jgi:long-chain acyl-CoA synthetase